MNDMISDAMFLDVFSRVSHSDFLGLNDKIPGMFVSEKKNSESEVMFLECTEAVTCPTLSFWRKSTEILQCSWNV
jgi:hypothetical protein